MTQSTLTRDDLLLLVDVTARERGIERDIVIEAMEEAIARAARSRYGHEKDIRATINPTSGAITLKHYMEVVEDVEDYRLQINLADAQTQSPGIRVGEYIISELPPIDFGRMSVQAAKQVIVQRVREAERERQYEDYKDRVGEIVNGIVKRVEYGNVTVDLGRAEGYMRRDEVIPGERIKRGERIRAYILDVRQELKGPQIFLSRTHPYFMAMLFSQEVPEIYDGIIEIMAAARDPGSRAKIAVRSNDSSIDPVGACVGMRGSRVQAVVGELQGEKIDIIPWNEDPATFIISALAPAEITKVILHESQQRIDVVVPETSLSLAIGRRGQNVRLASIISGWDIDIITEATESERRQARTKEQVETLTQALDVDSVIAHLLIDEGYETLEDLAEVSPETLATIEVFEQDMAVEISQRARDYVAKAAQDTEEKLAQSGLASELRTLTGFPPEVLLLLAEGGVLSLEDFAGLATDELLDPEDGLLRAYDLASTDADVLILQARAQAGWITDEECQTQILSLTGEAPTA